MLVFYLSSACTASSLPLLKATCKGMRLQSSILFASSSCTSSLRLDNTASSRTEDAPILSASALHLSSAWYFLLCTASSSFSARFGVSAFDFYSFCTRFAASLASASCTMCYGGCLYAVLLKVRMRCSVMQCRFVVPAGVVDLAFSFLTVRYQRAKHSLLGERYLPMRDKND